MPKWYYSRAFILVSLFVLVGPLGLPLLWKSPQFSKQAKVMLTVATGLYTVGMLIFGELLLQLLNGYMMKSVGIS